MSGWTTLTLRGLYSQDYDYSEYDSRDPYQANCDIAVTLQHDDRVADVGYWKNHVYAMLSTGRYDWTTAEQLLEDYAAMLYDAVVIGANDTSDTGKARYYPVHNDWNGDPDTYTDMYVETQSEDGCLTGAIAASVMTARHGIVAQETLRYRGQGSWDSGVDEYMEDKGRDMSEIL
jgi:hypothetical protein